MRSFFLRDWGRVVIAGIVCMCICVRGCECVCTWLGAAAVFYYSYYWLLFVLPFRVLTAVR
jgi:hypothetical protein